ncbi:sigma-70 family RNA polymerase sigma factor [Ichthyenterobacterium sp. W332]|uniref:Sigma-70 family RNA polymerase sigma factor n=1 Tax=Microcosmobacter mediterraneus TaxID=3075607 RepID=A0ABU2YGT4_9FLAO|nr:sigma-70 family RNA polymerase sigma factor [Ichthyenterobacterium sp. W332]MDT0557096.1 sigma-70 family RNA polymerase sigma factor [Ichthyenterobacterium sp. W332]
MQKVDLKSNHPTTESSIINAVKANDNDTLKSLYNHNYFKVETLVLKNNGTKDQAKDIYQEAFLAVWKNIKQDKFIPENESSIHGYLYTIAKHKWMDYLRSNTYKKTIRNTELFDLKDSKLHVHPSTEDHRFEEKLKLAMSAFDQLGEPCKSLLKAFYFDKKSMKDLAEELNLDAASVKNKKYRCMQKLRQLAQNLNTK